MTHDILSVKLYELDKAIGQMHSRIEQGEMDCPEQVEKDIQELRRECRENREMLHNKMKYSKAKLVGRIAEAYDNTAGRVLSGLCDAGIKLCTADVTGGNPCTE